MIDVAVRAVVSVFEMATGRRPAFSVEGTHDRCQMLALENLQVGWLLAVIRDCCVVSPSMLI